MSSTDSVVDVQDDLSADLEIKEASRVTSEELDLSRDFGTSEENKLNTVSVTSETSVVVDDPDKFDALDNGDDFRGLSGRTEDNGTRIGQVLEVDDFQGCRDEETGFSNNELEGSVAVVASGDRAVVGRSIKSALRTSANLSSARAESVEVSIDDSNNGEVNLVRNSDGCDSSDGAGSRGDIGAICSSRGDSVQTTSGARSGRVTRDRASGLAINSNGNS
jgi:hypothetical protein